MLKIIRERHKETTKKEELNFYNKENNEIQWGFPMIDEKVVPCKYEGDKLVPCKEEECSWWNNYLKVVADDSYYSKKETDVHSWIEPAVAKCDCGEEFQLVDEFYGSCSCPNCKRWYTLMGSPCLPPEEQVKCEDF